MLFFSKHAKMRIIIYLFYHFFNLFQLQAPSPFKEWVEWSHQNKQWDLFVFTWLWFCLHSYQRYISKANRYISFMIAFSFQPKQDHWLYLIYPQWTSKYWTRSVLFNALYSICQHKRLMVTKTCDSIREEMFPIHFHITRSWSNCWY